MAAVLLRRLLSSAFDEVYPALPPDVQTAIKSELLMIIQMETQSSMRKKICDIAAELARNLIGMCANTFIIMLLKKMSTYIFFLSGILEEDSQYLSIIYSVRNESDYGFCI